MSGSVLKGQEGVGSILVISLTTVLLGSLVLIATLDQVGPVVCMLARGLGLRSLI